MKRFNKFFLGGTIFILAIIVGIFFILNWTKLHMRDGLVETYRKQEELIAEQVARVFNLEMKNIQNSLYLLSLEPKIRYAHENSEACNNVLSNVSGLTGTNNLGRVGPSGEFVCSINSSLIGTRAETLGPYINDIFNDPEHKPVLSRIIKPPNIEGFALAVHVPVWGESGQFMGTLGGAIYLDRLHEQYLSSIAFAKRGFVVLIDDDGTILYHPTKELIAKNLNSKEFKEIVVDPSPLISLLHNIRKGESGNIRYSTHLEGQKIGAYRYIEVLPGRHWIILVTVPIADAYKELEDAGVNSAISLTILLLVLTIVMLGAAYFWLVNRLVLKPIDSLNKAKDEFISLASHQLRTPLTAIRLYTEMISNKTTGELNNKQKEYLEIIQDSTLRMIKLVGDILNVSRIQLGSLKIDPVPTKLNEMIVDIITEIAPAASERKLEIIFNNEISVREINLDQSLIRQVIHNLITNAIRYSNAEGKIEVQLRETLPAEKPSGYVISIIDKGIGIPKDNQDKIFTRFYRAENAIRKEGDGTGLGLYMAKMIIEVAKGKIWFESEEGKGTTFHVIIPNEGMTKGGGPKSLS